MTKQFTVVQQVLKNPEDKASRKMVEAEVIPVRASSPSEAYERAIDQMIMREIAQMEVADLRSPVEDFDFDFMSVLAQNGIEGIFMVYEGLHTASTTPSGPVAAIPGPPEGDPIYL